MYLDYAATTPLDPAVLKKMLPYFSGDYSNPSSMHTSGRRAGAAIKEAREIIAAGINASPEEIIFCGSGTEADNFAIRGIASANRASGNHIIISSVEHKAVMESARILKREGFDVTILPVDSYGMIDINQCLSLIRPETILISVMYANNEIGTVEPIEELGAALKKYKAGYTTSVSARQFPLLHTDACQATGALPLDVEKLGVDLMTLNSSKIYGPKGIGALYKRRGIRIHPLIAGGEQEMNLRAGTENVALIVGFAEAFTRALTMQEGECKRLTILRDYFIQELFKKIPDMILNGHPTKRLPNNIHISIPHIEGESMLLLLDKQGIEASTGSACSAHDLKPSHVLLAIGQTAEFAHGSLRFTLGRATTKRDLDRVLRVLPEIVRTLKSMSALTTTAIRIPA